MFIHTPRYPARLRMLNVAYHYMDLVPNRRRPRAASCGSRGLRWTGLYMGQSGVRAR